MFSDDFGSMVFSDLVMKERLSSTAYEKLMKIRKEGMPMDPSIVGEVAEAMKNWAIEKGATHYTHWFQPMTGITAEKHDSFIDKDGDEHPILKFSEKSLIKGEADASSFPSGGIRATFEARGYTVWDPASNVFIKENTLCIPTAFCSFNGAVLDKKTPLLRSMEALNTQAIRVLRLFGDDARYVYPAVGLEQEYFLIDKSDFAARRDLIITGRTLFGAPTPKGQVLDDHYYGSIRPRVKAFMADVDKELWRLGIFAKTEHNEVAPCQHEMAPVFARANVAVDGNQLTMELLTKIADRHGFVCLLHEKPFDGVNGSGKHNNWSIATDTGENLLDPGKEPENNLKFQLFLAAVVKAVDDYQDLLRVSVSTASNDRRLGGNEAPPTVISIYLGNRISTLVDAIVEGRHLDGSCAETYVTNTGNMTLTEANDDRNRTSPFAFTGNKFEFRMPGSSENVSCSNFVLNTAAAESLKQFAERLEPFAGSAEFEEELEKLIREELTAHRRIFFNGNGYSREWHKEAKRRGLMCVKSTPEAYAHYDAPKNVRLFSSHGILTETELEARKRIGLTKYVNIVTIEANTMLIMAEKDIIPAVIKEAGQLSGGIIAKENIGLEVGHERKLVSDMNEHVRALTENGEKMRSVIAHIPEDKDKAGIYVFRKLIPLMDEERRIVDELETMVSRESWPYPDYTDILYYVY